jgi:glycosyltransferase involved in cell wall biosynthesis
LKILHLYSDWRWTGPAEPALQACKGLQDRGHDVVVACRKAPADGPVDECVEWKIAEYGLTGSTDFALNRYLGIGDTISDLRRLPRYLNAEKIDIVHAHLSHDHVLSGVCGKLAGRGSAKVIHSLHKRTVLPDKLQYRIHLRRLADGLLVYTDSYRQRYIDEFNLDPDKVRLMPMTIDTERFRPGLELKDMRAEFNIAADAPVIGLVTRFQKYRRMEVFLGAAAKVVKERPDTRFVLLGASSQMQETVIKPIEELKLQDNVIVAGYRIDDYVDTLGCFDVFSLLMPGFDGTARAVREAMAMGLPSVVTDFGMLPDIIKDGETGLVVPSRIDELADAWLKLVNDPALRDSLGSAARKDAVERFQIDDMAASLEHSYLTWLGQSNG